MSAVSWNLQLAVNDGALNDFKTLMGEMVEATRGESGALNYEWFISEDGKVCHINEKYADSDATMEHLGAFGSKFAERFLSLVTPTAVNVYGDPKEDVREALKGLGPLHLGHFGGFSR
jgi:quinol monooxygenase YgiN